MKSTVDMNLVNPADSQCDRKSNYKKNQKQLREKFTNNSRKVHFTPPVSLESFEENACMHKHKNKDYEEQNTNYFYLVISVFALLIGCVAIGGCVFLYFELIQLSNNYETYKVHMYGSVGLIAKPDKYMQIAQKSQGWIKYIRNRTNFIEKKINRINAWIKFSGCVEGHDLVYRNHCYRLVNYKLSFKDAENFCLERKGFLAFAENEEIWNKTISFLKKRGFEKRELWTGLKKNELNSWIYTDGREASFIKWADGNIFDEGDDCAKVQINTGSSSVIYDCRCTDDDPEPRPFLCRFSVDI